MLKTSLQIIAAFTVGACAANASDLRPDPRCSSEFVEGYSLKEDCARLIDHDACLFLALTGAGAAGGLASKLASTLKKMNPDSERLAKFKKLYALELESSKLIVRTQYLENMTRLRAQESLYEQLTGNKPKKYSYESPQEYMERLAQDRVNYLEKHQGQTKRSKKWGVNDVTEPESILKSQINQEIEYELSKGGHEKFRDLFRTIKAKAGTDNFDLTTEVSRQLEADINRELPDEVAKYKQLREPVDKRIEEIVNQADKNFQSEMNKYESQIEALKKQRDSLPEANEKYKSLQDRINVLNSEMTRNAEIMRAKTLGQVLEVQENFNMELREKYPSLRTVKSLLNTASSPSLGTNSKIFGEGLKRLARTTRSQMAKAFASRAGVGAAAMDLTLLVLPEIAHSRAKNQVKNCAEDLKLSADEVELVEDNITALKANTCNTIRVKSAKKLLTEAEMKFGFVPVGICELALKENATLDATLEIETLVEGNCDKVKGPGFEISTNQDGKSQFSCWGTGSDLKYVFLVKPDGTVDFGKNSTQAFVDKNGKTFQAQAQAHEFVERVANLKRDDPYLVDTEATYLGANTIQALKQKGPDYTECFEKARKAEIFNLGPAVCTQEKSPNPVINTTRKSKAQGT